MVDGDELVEHARCSNGSSLIADGAPQLLSARDVLHRRRSSPKVYVLAPWLALGSAAVVSLMGSGCDDDANRASSAASPARSVPSAAVPPSGSGAGSTSPSSSASGESGSTNPLPAHVGKYGGDYESKKAEIALAPGVRVGDWKRDDGASATGMGKLLLDIAADGTVSGSIEGPLGPGLVRGVYSEGLLSASLSPGDPTRVDSFEGTLSGTLDGESLRVELSAATADARVARRAEAKLTRLR